MAAAYTAGAARLPFGMLRGYLGTDLPTVNAAVRTVTCPYTGERLATVPALNPDVTILHAQQADRAGNVLCAASSARRRRRRSPAAALIVTVEEVVDELDAPMNAVVLPHWVVTAIACVPGGARPSYARGSTRATTPSISLGTRSRATAPLPDWIDATCSDADLRASWRALRARRVGPCRRDRRPPGPPTR